MAVFSPERKKKLWKYGEVPVVSAVILIVWALYSIPSIVKFGPTEKGSSSATDDPYEMCVPQAYEGICKEHLIVYQSCISNSSSDNVTADVDKVVYIPASRASLEETARIIVPSLVFLNPSPECAAELAPFMCLNMFGICGDSGAVLRPSSSQCQRVISDVCATEWRTAFELFTMFEAQAGSIDADTVFPDCSSLPNDTSCDITSNTDTSTQPNRTNDTNMDTTATMAVRECSPDFYMDSFNICLPLCGEWEQYPHTTMVVAKTVVILSSTIFLIATVVVLVLSFIEHKRMFKFPSVFLIYQLVSGSAIPLVWLIGYANTSSFYCGHHDYGQSVLDPTTFCYFSGVVQYFITLFTSCLWLCHILVVLWGILHPIHARATMTNPRSSRCLHVTLLMACLMPPTIITSGTFIFGDYVTLFPPQFCASEHPSATYYFLNLPLTIVCAAGVTSLIFILTLLVRRRRTRQRSYAEAELKILISFFYFIILTLVAIIGFTIVLRNADEYEDELFKYFLCESQGNIGGSTCSRSGFESVDHTAITVPSIAVVLAIYPLVILTYVVKIRETKQRLSALSKKLSFTKKEFNMKRSWTTSTNIDSQVNSVRINGYGLNPDIPSNGSISIRADESTEDSGSSV